MYIGTTYLSPCNSTYISKLDYTLFDILEQEVAKYCKNGQMILIGDFNASTGTIDNVETSINPCIMPEVDSISFDVNRSQDCISSCTYGKQLTN